MEVLCPRYAGLDVHKDSVVAGVRLATDGPAKTEVRRFDTTTPGLLALSTWLAESGCTQVAMEATGVYRKRVWHILACRSAWKRLWRKVGAAIWHFLMERRAGAPAAGRAWPVRTFAV